MASRRKGYTLVELSVVLLILMMVVAIITPRMVNAMQAQKERQYRREVLELLRYAREDAIQSGESRTVTVRDDALEVLAENADSVQALRSLPTLDGMELGSFVSNGDSASQGDWSVTFYPSGESDGGYFSVASGSYEMVYNITEQGLVAIVEPNDESLSAEGKWEAGDSISTRGGVREIGG
jgi:Tfp pilus assembly protein FimT